MNLTKEYLQKFSKINQVHMIGAELERARIWENDDDKFKGALARALEIIDLMLHDVRWLGQIAMLLGLRDELCSYYIGIKQSDISKLYQAL